MAAQKYLFVRLLTIIDKTLTTKINKKYPTLLLLLQMDVIVRNVELFGLCFWPMIFIIHRTIITDLYTLFSCIISQSEKSISFRGSTETCFLTKLFFFVYPSKVLITWLSYA